MYLLFAPVFVSASEIHLNSGKMHVTFKSLEYPPPVPDESSVLKTKIIGVIISYITNHV